MNLTPIEVDAHGFPRTLPFASNTTSITRTVTMRARVLRAGDLLHEGTCTTRVTGTNLYPLTPFSVEVSLSDGTSRIVPQRDTITVTRTKKYSRMNDQRPTTEQLADVLLLATNTGTITDALSSPLATTSTLITVAVRNGMYDAADALRRWHAAGIDSTDALGRVFDILPPDPTGALAHA